MELSGKQEDFCQYFVMYNNAMKAAIKAGYSSKTAYRTGADNLKKPHVVERIEELKEQKFKELELSDGYVLEKIKTVLEFDPKDMCEISDGILKLKNLEDIPERIRKTIKSIKQKKYGIEITLMDKDKNLEMLARIRGMFKDNTIFLENAIKYLKTKLYDM